MTNGDAIDPTTTEKLKFFDLSISVVIVFIAKVSAISEVTSNLTNNMVIAFDVTEFFVDKWVG